MGMKTVTEDQVELDLVIEKRSPISTEDIADRGHTIVAIGSIEGGLGQKIAEVIRERMANIEIRGEVRTEMARIRWSQRSILSKSKRKHFLNRLKKLVSIGEGSIHS